MGRIVIWIYLLVASLFVVFIEKMIGFDYKGYELQYGILTIVHWLCGVGLLTVRQAYENNK